jgi:hypothetical protein
MLIEDTTEVNIATLEDPKTILFATSLKKEEKLEFQEFLTKRKINFRWLYVDMSRLDLELVLHHIPLPPKAKLLKQKLWKMHL